MRKAPVWEVRHSRGTRASIWGLYDHALDAYGRSHQVLFGGNRIKSQALFRLLLHELIGEAAISAFLLCQQDSPRGLHPSGCIPVKVGSSEMQFAVLQGLAVAETIDRFLIRNGSDPDDVPDLLWFPASDLSKQHLDFAIQFVRRVSIHQSEDVGTEQAGYSAESAEWSHLLKHSSLASLLGGHLYLLTNHQSDDRILEVVMHTAGALGIGIPQKLPELEDGDPLGSFLAQMS